MADVLIGYLKLLPKIDPLLAFTKPTANDSSAKNATEPCNASSGTLNGTPFKNITYQGNAAAGCDSPAIPYAPAPPWKDYKGDDVQGPIGNSKMLGLRAIPAPKLPPNSYESPMSVERFFLIWREYGNAPVQKHYTLASAEAEADRLARMNPGSRFFVLSTLEAVSLPKPPDVKKLLATWQRSI